MSIQEKNLKELHKKALEAAERISEEEKKLIKEIVESSPNSIMYLGYIPVHLRGSSET
jgi:DNA mismatch repair ATPase MutS